MNNWGNMENRNVIFRGKSGKKSLPTLKFLAGEAILNRCLVRKSDNGKKMTENYINWKEGKNISKALDELLAIFTSSDDFSSIFRWFQRENISISSQMDAYEFTGVLYQQLCEEQQIQETNYRKHNGIYYTESSIAKQIVSDIVEKRSVDSLLQSTFFEPCVGVGIFVLTYVDNILKRFRDISPIAVQAFVDRIYCADIDAKAVCIAKLLLQYHIRVLTGFKINLKDSNFYIGNVLFNFSNSNDAAQEADLEKIFGINKFDIIATNPPYKLLKLNKNKYADKEGSLEKNQYDAMLKVINGSGTFRLQSGTCNYYKLFLEKIFCSYVAANGSIGLLIPNTFLNDKSCDLLRKNLFSNFVVHDIYIIPENNDFFTDICQSFCFFTAIYSGKPGKELIIRPDVKSKSNFNQDTVLITLSELLEFSSSYSVLVLPRDGWSLLRLLNSYPSMKSISYLANLRGEFDLTLCGKWIQTIPSDYPLITGKCIGQFVLTESHEYANRDFVDQLKGKKEFLFAPRLLCQQISNMHQKHRLKFTMCDKVAVVGNSCNFLSIIENGDLFDTGNKVSLTYLLGVLNSLLLDWRFRITSSNNHINNYELDELPIVIPDTATMRSIEVIVEKIQKEPSPENLAKLNVSIFSVYKLSTHAIKYILHYYENLQPELVKNIEKIFSTQQGKTNQETERIMSVKSSEENHIATLYNHESYQLSALDMRMVKSIPPGGNWQNIPDDIPSQRVQRIKTTGGRTTLYGRLRWDAPSYTITTFFNRPGNGCYIHPEQDRVISAREAARLQSFPDSYIFYGAKTSYCKQIGNAVPPLMAYAIARQIKSQTGCSRLLDLFCGAGGLSVGFRNAGYKIVAANDNFKQACETYRKNHPDTIMLEGDITNSKVKEELVKCSKEGNVDIVVGGPPCQGFSYAGHRMIDDPRNFLYKEYVEIVSKITPKVFLMENVEGILTSNNGKTYQSICDDFSSLGYTLHGEKLFATWFGVPQKRKRVIIIGVREGNPENCYPRSLLTDEALFTTTREAIGNLPAISMGGGELKVSVSLSTKSDYQRFIEGKISFAEYYEILTQKGENSTSLEPSLF